MEQIKILIIDQNQIVLRDLRMLVETEKEFKVVGTIADFSSLLDFLKNKKAGVDIILMDLDLPKMIAFERISYLKSHYPEIKIILASIHGDNEFILKGIEAGVSAYILKGSSIEEIIAIIKSVYSYGKKVRHKVTKSQRHR
ncbi:MAG: response regulator transcription factor [Actinobacteria bacterium]|nr:response regulator transcription factor [Actinomycetota bacterium]